LGQEVKRAKFHRQKVSRETEEEKTIGQRVSQNRWESLGGGRYREGLAEFKEDYCDIGLLEGADL